MQANKPNTWRANLILDVVKDNIDNESWLGRNHRHQIQEIMTERDFFLQKGQDAYHDFINYPVEYSEIQSAYDKIQNLSNIEDIRTELFDSDYSFNKTGAFEEKYDRLLTYFDNVVKDTKGLNEYEPKRSIAKKVIHLQIDLYKQLILHKMGEYDKLKPSFSYAIDYITDPVKNISITPESHRKTIATDVLGNNEYEHETFTEQLKAMFEPYRKYCANDANYTVFIARWFYTDDVNAIWSTNIGTFLISDRRGS